MTNSNLKFASTWNGKAQIGAVLHKRTRTPNLIFLFSVVINILVELTRAVFDLESMATKQLQDDMWSDQR